MTDHSLAERNALAEVWYITSLHISFLQSCWTWLHDGNNKIKNDHRTELITQVKQMVYAKSVLELETLHNKFSTNKLVSHYPKFKSYIEKWWHKRLE